MDRPPGGWSDLVTNQTLDLELDALEHRMRAEFRDQITRLVRWIVPTIFAGVAAMGAIAGAVGGIVAASS
jgi:type II secretory pathway component PulF